MSLLFMVIPRVVCVPDACVLQYLSIEDYLYVHYLCAFCTHHFSLLIVSGCLSYRCVWLFIILDFSNNFILELHNCINIVSFFRHYFLSMCYLR